jgi:hypothetical protein
LYIIAILSGAILVWALYQIGYQEGYVMILWPLITGIVIFSLTQPHIYLRHHLDKLTVVAIPPTMVCAQLFSKDHGTGAGTLFVQILLLGMLVWALGFIVLGRNSWNLGSGQTVSMLVSGVILSGVWALLEHEGAHYLRHVDGLPHNATIAALLGFFIFGIVLHPLKHFLEHRAEHWQLGHKLASLLEEVPGLLDTMVRFDAGRRSEEVKRFLSVQLNLQRYAFYQRRGNDDGSLTWVHDTYSSYTPPVRLHLSRLLMARLAKERRIIDLAICFQEVEYSPLAPELWRLQRYFGHSTSTPETPSKLTENTNDPPQRLWRCQYLLPISIGGSLLGLLVIGEQPISSSLRSDGFFRSFRNVGVTAT